MNFNERADNMSKCKLTISNLVIIKMLEKDDDSTVQNDPIIETTISQDKEAVTIEENKPFPFQMTFAFLKENLEKDKVLTRPIGSDNSNGCIKMSSKWI